jgi:hypothetical protein
MYFLCVSASLREMFFLIRAIRGKTVFHPCTPDPRLQTHFLTTDHRYD